MKPRHVVIVAFPGLQPLDAVGPFEVFAGCGPGGGRARPGRRLPGDPGLDRRAPVRAESGLGLCTVPLPDAVERIDTLVLPGGDGVAGGPPRPGPDGLDRGRRPRLSPGGHGVLRVPSSPPRPACSTAGRVTTHWASAEPAGRRSSRRCAVDADPIYIRDGKFWTSAGVTAGIDLALALVEDDLGSEVAQTVARWLVMFLHRPGRPDPVRLAGVGAAGRALDRPGRADPGRDRARRRPSPARRWPRPAAMSVRHFTRVFTAEVGETPGRFVERVRLEAARRELETTDATLDAVAARAGSAPPRRCGGSSSAGSRVPRRLPAALPRRPTKGRPHEPTACRSPSRCSPSSPRSTPSAPTRSSSASPRSTSSSSATSAARSAARTACSG